MVAGHIFDRDPMAAGSEVGEAVGTVTSGDGAGLTTVQHPIEIGIEEHRPAGKPGFALVEGTIPVGIPKHRAAYIDQVEVAEVDVFGDLAELQRHGVCRPRGAGNGRSSRAAARAAAVAGAASTRFEVDDGIGQREHVETAEGQAGIGNVIVLVVAIDDRLRRRAQERCELRQCQAPAELSDGHVLSQRRCAGHESGRHAGALHGNEASARARAGETRARREHVGQRRVALRERGDVIGSRSVIGGAVREAPWAAEVGAPHRACCDHRRV